ncbi:MAG TPA: permease [Mesotoga sp.]|nr:permease [Mesotoga sp.]MDI9375897.1 permease [Thermotogota bacterium]NLX35025.1 permease [Thermotogaceae bacterium]MDD4040213.1 permease [Mesotoga sp.]MDD4478610.1 permease [Mesotoga sp.]
MNLSAGCGFDYIKGLVETLTPMGRKRLYDISFLTERGRIEVEYDRQEDLKEMAANPDKVVSIISRFRDISATLENLAAGAVLDDVELFEIKSFAIWNEKLRERLGDCPGWMRLPDLSTVIDLLDPEKTGLESFYISDLFDGSLPELRRKIAQCQRSDDPHDRERAADLLEMNARVESKVRARLSKELEGFSDTLSLSLNRVGDIDLTLAKAILNERLKLARPSIVEDAFSFEGLFNPEVASVLSEKNKEFQSYSLSLRRLALVIGGNMTGKSLFLRTLALAQTMFQHGFFVPAKEASLTPYDRIVYYSGDHQSFENGLSSFAGEVEFLKEAVGIVSRGERGLFLFDEIGKNTNPLEGPAFLLAAMEYLGRGNGCRAVFSSHYEEALENREIQMLMVRGLDHEKLAGRERRDISFYIDHTVQEIDEFCGFPREGTVIARLLGMDDDFLKLVEKHLWRKE